MRGIYLNILGCIITILLICISCQSNPDQKKKQNQDTYLLNTKRTDTVIEYQDSTRVHIDVRPNILETKGNNIKGVYFMANNLDVPINFGSDFIVEKKIDELWTKEPFVESLGFEDVIFSLNPGSSKKYPLLLSKVLKKVNPGEYRIKKEVWPVGKKEEKVTVTAKFSIQ